MSGFVALYRDVFTHPLLKDGDRFRAWFWLVSNAAWKPTRHDARGKTIEVERGQLCAGREYLAKEWNWSPSAVERFLTRLETEHMIERETGQGKSLITICNYAKYQNLDDKTGQTTGQTTGQKSDRNRTAKEQGNKETSLEEEEEEEGETENFGSVENAARRIGSAGGINHNPSNDHQRYADNLSHVREWMKLGATVDEMVACARQACATNTEPIRTFRYLDPSIRQAIARRENNSHGTPETPRNYQRRRYLDPSKDIDAAARSLGFD